MSGDMNRYWWDAIWTRILRGSGRSIPPSSGAATVAGAGVLEIGNAIGAAPWTILPGSVDPATPLEVLAYLSLDTETTGLDPARDSIVSIGLVPIAGGRIDRAAAFDCLVNPGRPIPPSVIAIHGIGDETVADAAGFSAIVDRVLESLGGSVTIGHHLGFDFAVLRREAEAAGRQWRDPPALDTMLLAAAIWPRLHDLSLDALARRLGVDTAGRHSARGDAIIAAEVFLGLCPLLRHRGILTLGAALAAQELARRDLLLKIRSWRWRWRWI